MYKKIYTVEISGVVEIEAEDEDEAIAAAISSFDKHDCTHAEVLSVIEY